MIALIEFDDDLVLLREKAEELKLRCQEVDRVGIQNDTLQVMGTTWHYYKDELIEEDGKYYPKEKKNNKDDKKEVVEPYYIYARPPEENYVKIQKGGHLVDLVWFVDKCRIPYRVMEAIKSEMPTVDNVSVLLKRVEEKTEQVLSMAETIQHREFNEKCNVHVGGGMIATYNEVMLKENACTDELQVILNNGWRLIACCVQPDARRPDYILGRYNSNLEVSESQSAGR